MNKAEDVARYVINHSILIEKPISHLKLQKILYYIQASFLVENKRPAFSEKIVNWAYGPVVPEIYSTFKKYGYQDITEPINYKKEMILDPDTLDISFDELPFNDEIIDEQSKKLIDKIINSYKDITAITMMKKTHRESPWIETKNGQEIKTELIYQYYIGNKEKIFAD